MNKDDKIILLELLKMARELVINEYIDKRAQDHNDWLVQSDVAWCNHRMKLAYPAFPPYPTEIDILNRAKALHSFLYAEEPVIDNTVDTVVDLPAAVAVEDVKENTKIEKTNYVSDPTIFEKIINKQTESTPAAPVSALSKLKNSLGLK